ncbi:MAG: transporter substrate-binding domain-containing protein [Cellvibrionaceae bacterium]
MKKLFFVTVFCLVYLSSVTSHARSIEEIKKSGYINVAVKADYKPFGYLNASGANEGLEIDLAKDVAKSLGVDIKYMAVTSSTRMPAVADGKADLMIATMTDKPDRRKIVYTIDVPYYSSGTNILAHKKSNIKQWLDIRGRNICGTKGAYYNDFVVDTFGAKVVSFESSDAALEGLRAEKCEAYVFDDSFILGKLSDPKWSNDFGMPLDTIDDAPWGLAVKLGNQSLYDFMKEKVISWHKDKFILGLEDKYGIKNSKYALKMSELFKGQ